MQPLFLCLVKKMMMKFIKIADFGFIIIWVCGTIYSAVS